MSAWRRIFTAPGNPRVWLSLVLYGTALAAILVYRERIGQKAAQTFQELTGTPPAPPAPPRETPGARLRRLLALAPGERELQLLALARADDVPARDALARLMRPGGGARILPALVEAARPCLDEGPRALRAVCAAILLTHERVARERATARALEAPLRDRKNRAARRDALRRLGWLGLCGVRSRAVEARVVALLSAAEPDARSEAARALGRIADAAHQPVLLRLVRDDVPSAVRGAALAGLVDLGLADDRQRSRVLRALAAVLADRTVRGERAEQTWQALRRLAAGGRSESRVPTEPAGSPASAPPPTAAPASPPPSPATPPPGP